MDDLDVVRRIGELADERHRPGRSRAGEGRAEGELARPRTIGVALDRCRDLPRERRARRAAGDLDGVAVRPDPMVGGYPP